jgi:hypothetical protein
MINYGYEIREEKNEKNICHFPLNVVFKGNGGLGEWGDGVLGNAGAPVDYTVDNLPKVLLTSLD